MTIDHLFTARDETDWRNRLPATRCVFGSIEYARIVEKHLDYSARLFSVEDDDSSITYPVFLRPIQDLPFATNSQDHYWDTLSPEYTGPFLIGQPSSYLEVSFAERWSVRCDREHIVAEFAHLHPWDSRPSCLKSADLQFNREIVYVDLTWPMERLWSDSYNHACRKNISRAQRETVRVVTAESDKDVEEFYRIYLHTMQRNQASGRYYFSLDYFLDFFRLLPQHARFALALFQDKIVAGTLYLHDDANIYSYLGGADHAFQHVRPTNAIVHEIIQWGKRLGKRRLILGSGYQPNDGISRFKAGFSPLRTEFFVYKRIHRDDIYSSLCEQWMAHFGPNAKPGGYFPAYRELPPTEDNTV